MDEINDREFHQDDLRRLKCIVHPRQLAGYNNIEVYPLQKVLDEYGSRFYSNGICYMLAYAMLNGYRRIELYGVDMMPFDSYIMELPGVSYWLGRCEHDGIECVIPAESHLGKTCDGKLYGWYGQHYGGENAPDLADGFE
jgi:hypothetical protein